MGQNKMDLLDDKRLPLTNKSILSQKSPHPSHNLLERLYTKGTQDGRDVLNLSHIPPLTLTYPSHATHINKNVKGEIMGGMKGEMKGGIKILRVLYLKGVQKIYGRD